MTPRRPPQQPNATLNHRHQASLLPPSRSRPLFLSALANASCVWVVRVGGRLLFCCLLGRLLLFCCSAVCMKKTAFEFDFPTVSVNQAEDPARPTAPEQWSPTHKHPASAEAGRRRERLRDGVHAKLGGGESGWCSMGVLVVVVMLVKWWLSSSRLMRHEHDWYRFFLFSQCVRMILVSYVLPGIRCLSTIHLRT